MNVKTEAFRTMYLPYGQEIATRVVVHHLANGGISRFDKFRLYHGEWLGIKVTDELLRSLAKQFSTLVMESVIKAPEVPGASEFLYKNREKYKFWIISGTPTDEMKRIARKRKIYRFFHEIFGSPVLKTVWAAHIIKEWDLKPEETVFVGDANTDYEAAVENDLHFILRETKDNAGLFIKHKGPRIRDFTELETVLQKIQTN